MTIGRPRQFDIDEALDCALDVFWRKGYEGTSLSDLTAAMGITRPSLYAAFGNKEALFRKALDRYVERFGAHVREALAEPTARRVVEHLLMGVADRLSDPHNPPGCLTINGAIACSEAAEGVRQELIALRATAEAALRERLERAKAAGDLAEDADPEDLARYVATVAQGMSVQAAGGAGREELRRLAAIVLRGWPN